MWHFSVSGQGGGSSLDHLPGVPAQRYVYNLCEEYCNHKAYIVAF